MYPGSPIFALHSSDEWPEVMDLRCTLLCCRMVEGCADLSYLKINAGINDSQPVLDGLWKANMSGGTRDDLTVFITGR